MKAHLAAIPLVLLEQVSALQPQLDVRGDWAEDVFAALRRDHIRAPLDMTEPRLEPLLDEATWRLARPSTTDQRAVRMRNPWQK